MILVSWIYQEARQERLEHSIDSKTIQSKNEKQQPELHTPRHTCHRYSYSHRQILHRALEIVVYDRMSLDYFAKHQETTVTRNRTTTIATHTVGEKMREIF